MHQRKKSILPALKTFVNYLLSPQLTGTWQSARFSVSPNTWSRIDLTFAATGGGANVGDGESYTDRYVY